MTANRPLQRRAARQAFTLLELMLVLALLVVFAALAWPAIDASLSGVLLRKAAQQIGTVWGNARLNAMTEGTIYVFRYQPGDNQYSVGPWESTTDTPSDTAPVSSDTVARAVTSADSLNQRADTWAAGHLPKGLVFGGPDDQTAAGQATTETLQTGTAPNTPTATQWLVFYPDGTTTDGVVTILNDRHCSVTISLRGITGASSIGELAEVSTGP